MLTDAKLKEDLRHVVLEVLAVRHPAALASRAIRRRAAVELDFALEDADVDTALALLSDMGLARAETDSLGSTRYWSATAGGVLAFERGNAPRAPRPE